MNDATVAANFKAHCPRCFRREWIVSPNPDIVQCDRCHYLFALRGDPVLSQPPPPPSAGDFHYSFADALAHAKRERVRQLVYVMLDKYSFQSCTAAEAVKIANDLDDEIERIGAPKNA
jgi:ribosomal protein L37AE/L43A